MEEAAGRRGPGDAAFGQRGVARAPRVLGVADVLRRLLDEAADADRGPVGDGEPRCAPRRRDGREELAGPGAGPPRLEERVGRRLRAAPLAGEGAQQEHVARGVADVREPVGCQNHGARYPFGARGGRGLGRRRGEELEVLRRRRPAAPQRRAALVEPPALRARGRRGRVGAHGPEREVPRAADGGPARAVVGQRRARAAAAAVPGAQRARRAVVAEGEPGLAPAPARHAGAARHHGLLGLEDARLRARRAGRREGDERRRGAVGAGKGQRDQAAQCPHRIIITSSSAGLNSEG